MPYCGRCLNVGIERKRGAPPKYGPVQPRQRCATSSGSTDSEPGQHVICGKPALLDKKFCRINTAVAPRSNTSPGLSLAFVHEDLPGRAPASSAVVTTAACFGMTMSSSIACASASGSAQQSRTTTKR